MVEMFETSSMVELGIKRGTELCCCGLLREIHFRIRREVRKFAADARFGYVMTKKGK
jgi:hypothetical protein